LVDYNAKWYGAEIFWMHNAPKHGVC